MARKSSKRSQKFFKRYLRERGVPVHNERFGERSQLADRELPVQQTPDEVKPCKARTVDGRMLPKHSAIDSCQ